MNSYKDKRKSDKDLEGEEKSNPHNGKNNLHLDNEQKKSKPNSKRNLTSAEFIALKERGLRVLDEKIKKGLTDSGNGNNNQHLDEEPSDSIPKSKSGLTSTELAILKKVIADGLFSEMKMPMADGSKYQGERYKGQKHGQGILILPNGERYEGQFANDQAHGEGVYTWPDGVRSEGEFREGKPWSVVGYDEHGEICGLFVDGEVEEVYTNSHRCANQRQYKELKETNINQQQEINHE